jgi:hypothetical protein
MGNTEPKVDLGQAQEYAEKVLGVEVQEYDRRLHERTKQFVFRESRQADLFAAVNAAADAERDLDREIDRKRRFSHLAQTLEGCIADGCTKLRMVVTTRRGAEKPVLFENATRAARFAMAVKAARLPWRVERQAQERLQDRDAARLVFEHRLSRAKGVQHLQYLLGRGLPYAAVLASSLKADRTLQKILEEEKAKRWRYLQRRWKEVGDEKTRVAAEIAKGDSMERVLGGIGVRPETYAGDAVQALARRASLQAMSESNQKLLDSHELQDLFCSLPVGPDRPMPARIVVVESAADALAHRQIHGTPEGDAYIAVGRGPVEDPNSLRQDGLATNGWRFEKVLLSERWRAWEQGREAPEVVFALGTAPASKARATVLKKLVPSRMNFVREAPEHGATWGEDLKKREREYIREMNGRGVGRSTSRSLGISP